MELIMRITILLLLSFTLSCSIINRTRKNLNISTAPLKGGVFHDKKWNDKLIFKRYSWYSETILHYDILLAKLDTKSKFSNWLEADKYKIENCAEFYIALIYAKPLERFSKTYLITQIEKQQTKSYILPDFSAHLRSHPNLRDWGLDRHRVLGLCRNTLNKNPYVIDIPGYESFKLK